MNESGIPRHRQVRWVALLAATVFALYLCWQMLKPFIEVLLWAVVLVIVFYPVHTRILKRVKRPGWAAVLSCLIVIVAILVPLTLLTFAIVRELKGFAESLQGNLQSFLDPQSPIMGRALNWLGQYVDVEQLRSGEFFAERVKSFGSMIAGRTLGFVGGAVGVVVEVFFVIFTMYYMFRDGERMRATLRSMLPLEEGKSREILERTREVISASVYGVLVIATIQGTLGGLAFWVLGLPSPLLWGVVMIFFSMIPMAGAFVVWGPAAIYLALTGHVGQAIALTLIGVLVIGSIDNFLRPKLVGEKTRLHELLIFFSVLGGLQVFGVLGLVLGPVIVAIAMALLDILRHSDGRMTATTPDSTLAEEQEDIRTVPEVSA
ncbi:MAG TPA: AI-2E family transporter [Pyrinomonadaceae bacterium]|nr:AI-2E family transporter [Pyrinomonadaceae bacterium]